MYIQVSRHTHTHKGKINESKNERLFKKYKNYPQENVHTHHFAYSLRRWPKGSFDSFFFFWVEVRNSGQNFWSNDLPKQRKSGGFLWEPMCIHTGKHFRCGHILDHTKHKEQIPKHVCFKVIVQEGKMLTTFLGMSRSKTASGCAGTLLVMLSLNYNSRQVDSFALLSQKVWAKPFAPQR